jgi:hypothetical protein
LQEWPYSLFTTHSHVSAVILRQNRLQNVDSRIGICRDIAVLDLSHNIISTVCPEVGLLSALQRLSLSFNKLSFLPSTFSFLINLREIKLDSNAFDAVPLALQQTSLTSLSRISLQVPPPKWRVVHTVFQFLLMRCFALLQSNLVRSLDPELCHLAALESLSIEGNPVQFRCGSVALLHNVFFLTISRPLYTTARICYGKALSLCKTACGICWSSRIYRGAIWTLFPGKGVSLHRTAILDMGNLSTGAAFDLFRFIRSMPPITLFLH